MERESQCLFKSSGEPRDGRDWNRTIFNRGCPLLLVSSKRTPFCILQIEFDLCSISSRNLSAWQHQATILPSYRDPYRIRRNDLFHLTNREESLDLTDDSTVRSRDRGRLMKSIQPRLQQIRGIVCRVTYVLLKKFAFHISFIRESFHLISRNLVDSSRIRK